MPAAIQLKYGKMQVQRGNAHKRRPTASRHCPCHPSTLLSIPSTTHRQFSSSNQPTIQFRLLFIAPLDPSIAGYYVGTAGQADYSAVNRPSTIHRGQTTPSLSVRTHYCSLAADHRSLKIFISLHNGSNREISWKKGMAKVGLNI